MPEKSESHPMSTQTALNRTVTDLHLNKTGKVSNKWSSYLPYYDKLFSPYMDKSMSLLEIGIQNGGSLDTWASYFRHAKIIMGCDIDEKCRALSFEDPRIQVIVGNANSDETYKTISSHAPFDIIIDDGSHLSEDILIGFLNYFPLLQQGGTYVIEDTHAIYMRELTNITQRNTALAFFKDLSDIPNYQFWFRERLIADHLQAYLTVPLPGFLSEGWIESIEFRNSIITIHKSATASHNKLGHMVVRGNEASVNPELLGLRQ
jgi:cephalosporin hydroxylase